MASRLTQRHKATMLVTEQTLNQVMNEARELVQRIGHNDPRAQELKQLYNDIAEVLHNSEGGARTEMFDDAYNHDAAIELKAAVDRISAIKNEIRPGQQSPAIPAQQPVAASLKAAHQHLECPDCEASGFKNQQELDGHVDKKHKGRMASQEEGAPMSSRLFARKRKHVEAEEEMLDAAPEAVAGDAPTDPLLDGDAGLHGDDSLPAVPAEGAPPAPAVNAPTAGNSYANLPTQALTAIAEALTKVDEWQSNPAILGAIEQVAEELKNRPMTPAAPEGAPKMSSRKIAVTPPGVGEDLMHKLKKEYPGEPDKAYATAWKIHNEGAAEAPAGWEPATQAMRATGMTPPQANVLANWMDKQGYTPHKASFMVKRGRIEWLKSKLAAVSTGVPPVNEDTLNKVDGQPHEVKEIGEAHADREGVEKAEKHNDKPGASVTTITSPQDLNKTASEDEVSKALKTAESLEKKLGELYLDAKPIIRANASAVVRDAVESIYEAKNKFAEAKKVLNRHEMQAAAEEEAQDKALNKKKASLTLGLELAAAE